MKLLPYMSSICILLLTVSTSGFCNYTLYLPLDTTSDSTLPLANGDTVKPLTAGVPTTVETNVPSLQVQMLEVVNGTVNFGIVDILNQHGTIVPGNGTTLYVDGGGYTRFNAPAGPNQPAYLVQSPTPSGTGVCVPVTLTLKDIFGNTVAAAYDRSFSSTGSPYQVTFSGASTCHYISALVIPAGSSSVNGYAKIQNSPTTQTITDGSGDIADGPTNNAPAPEIATFTVSAH